MCDANDSILYLRVRKNNLNVRIQEYIYIYVNGVGEEKGIARKILYGNYAQWFNFDQNWRK